MALYKRGDSPFWWYTFKIDGIRINQSSGTADCKLAEKIYHQSRSQAQEGKYFPIRLKVKLYEMIDFYLNDYSKTAKKSYINDVTISRTIKKFFSDCLLSEITPHKIEIYRAHRLKSVSKARTNRELAFLRHMFTKAIDWGKWAGENTIKKVKAFKEERKPERYLTQDERKRLFKASLDFLKPIILTALKTGMRQSEILNLKWENVDLQRAVIFVRNTKAGKMRELPIHGELLEVISSLLRTSTYVFSNSEGKTYSRNGVFRSAFDRAVKEAKIPNFTFHDLRHTFASELIMRGVDVKTVQEYLGHSTITITERYLHVAPDQKRSSIQLLSTEGYTACYASATLRFERVIRNGKEFFKIPDNYRFSQSGRVAELADAQDLKS